MRAWCEAGFRPADFWWTTPREYGAALRGVGDRLIREHDGRMLASFRTGVWSRESPMTPLRDFLLGPQAKAEPKMADTPAEIQRAFDAWVIVTGGELGRGKRRRRKHKDEPAQGAG